jgi:serine protease
MKLVIRSLLRALLAATVLLASVAAMPASRPVAAGADPAGPDAAQFELPVDQLIVKYKSTADVSGANAPSGAGRMEALSAAAGVKLAYFREMSGDAHVLSLPGRMPVADAEQIAKRLMTLPDVEYAEPNRIMQVTLSPNDPQYGDQWHYFETYGINAPTAWDITTGSASIVVAVIDTGYTDHPDLSGRFVGGYDFITSSTTANDGGGRDADAHDPGDWYATNECGPGIPGRNSTWHGTHVAGTIGAASNNSTGVAGINWVSKILPVRVLGKCGGTTADIVDGMRWAAGLAVSGVPANANPAKVLNLSLGGSGACSATWQNGIDAINAVGATIVVAAGNSNANASGFSPASCNGVITVAATNRNGQKASYSNFGSVVEISAPGGETGTSSPDPAPQNGVLSTLNSGTTTPSTSNYVYYQGTSMAAPHVAGVASLILSMNSSLTYTQVLQTMQSTVTPFPGGGTCTTSNCGSGIVNAAAALGTLSPQITSLNPPAALAGSSALTLTVNGAGFSNGSVVKWNGSNRVTQYVSPSQLRAGILTGDLVTPGVASVVVSGTLPAFVTTAKTFLIYSSQAFLPVVLKNHTSSVPNPIQNPGFESGHVAWAESSIVFPGQLITNDFQSSGVTAHGGAWATWLGGEHNEVGSIQQTVTVPAGNTTLGYWHWVLSSEAGCGFDLASVRVNGVSVDSFGLCTSTLTGGWVKRTVNLAAYAGQSVQLQFRVQTDSSVFSSWFIDDVALEAPAPSIESGGAATTVPASQPPGNPARQ